jgi:hypothetical protein
MPPNPPSDSYEATSYAEGDQIYYYRNGTFPPPSSPRPPTHAATKRSTLRQTLRPCIFKGRWRVGAVVGPGGSSDDSPRYEVSPLPQNTSREYQSN